MIQEHSKIIVSLRSKFWLQRTRYNGNFAIFIIKFVSDDLKDLVLGIRDSDSSREGEENH